MADSRDTEKKHAAVDDTLADDRSTAEGQVYRSEGAHADLTSERRYGESERIVPDYGQCVLTFCFSPKARFVAVAVSQHDVLLQLHRSSMSCTHTQTRRLFQKLLQKPLTQPFSQSNLGNAETDGMGDDLHFVGQEYSLLVLLFYIPNGLCDLPLNMLTKRFSGKIMLPLLMTGWGAMSMLQAACTSFAGILVVRLILA